MPSEPTCPLSVVSAPVTTPQPHVCPPGLWCGLREGEAGRQERVPGLQSRLPDPQPQAGPFTDPCTVPGQARTWAPGHTGKQEAWVLLPLPPTPPRRAHLPAESSRWWGVGDRAHRPHVEAFAFTSAGRAPRLPDTRPPPWAHSLQAADPGSDSGSRVPPAHAAPLPPSSVFSPSPLRDEVRKCPLPAGGQTR